MTGPLYRHIYKIWLFSLVAARRSLKRAAVAARITQAALSREIAVLEGVLGKTLLAQTSSTFELTEEGEAFLARANPVLIAIGKLAAHYGARRRVPAPLGRR